MPKSPSKKTIPEIKEAKKKEVKKDHKKTKPKATSLPKESTKKASRTKASPKATASKAGDSTPKAPKPAGKVSISRPIRKESARPAIRAVYSNSKLTLMVLGFGADYKTKKCVVIFSDLQSGEVYTTALTVWNRWKLKEVKRINPET